MTDKHVVVDGSNIATEGRTAPSLQQLDEAVRAFVSQHPHDKVTVVVDATFGHRIASEEHDIYEQAMLAGELVSPPAGAIGRGDAFVLQIADVADATVLSNDSFQEFHGQYTWLFDEGRLIGGKPVPEVGWVFVLRSPVRGPLSRRSPRDTRSTRTRKAKQAVAPTVPVALRPLTAAKLTGAAKKNAAGHAPRVGDALPVAEPAGVAGVGGSAAVDPAGGPAKAARPRRRRGAATPPEPVNERMVFIQFVAEHPVGSLVDAVVDRFSSHGAYLVAGDAQCYIPLRALSHPPPRSAREVLTVGEERPFVVASFDAARCGIDLALPDPDLQIPAPEPVALPDPNQQELPQEAPPMATKKSPARKAASKTAAKKTGSTKKTSSAKKTPSRTSSTAKKSTAKKSTAKKSTAKKSTAKKSGGTARKTTTRSAPAKAASTAKGAATRARKAATTARKAAGTAKQAAKKASAASKSTAKKSGAKKGTATKTASRKTPAKRTA